MFKKSNSMTSSFVILCIPQYHTPPYFQRFKPSDDCWVEFSKIRDEKEEYKTTALKCMQMGKMGVHLLLLCCSVSAHTATGVLDNVLQYHQSLDCNEGRVTME